MKVENREQLVQTEVQGYHGSIETAVKMIEITLRKCRSNVNYQLTAYSSIT